MKRKYLLIALMTAAFLLLTISAQGASYSARALSDVHVGKTKTELKAQMAYSNYQLSHFKIHKYRWKLLPRHATCWSHVRSKNLRQACNYARLKVFNHRYLYKVAKEKYDILYVPHQAPVDSCGASASACAWYYDGATQCEVNHEGSFTSVSPGGKYHGRFQMDSSFEASTSFGRSMQDRYGSANNWPPGAQIEHAYTVWLSSGWSPWPPYYVYGCAAYQGRSYH